MQKNTVHLPPSFLVFFINTFIGESPFRFCDIFYEYFEINFKKLLCYLIFLDWLLDNCPRGKLPCNPNLTVAPTPTPIIEI